MPYFNRESSIASYHCSILDPFHLIAEGMKNDEDNSLIASNELRILPRSGDLFNRTKDRLWLKKPLVLSLSMSNLLGQVRMVICLLTQGLSDWTAWGGRIMCALPSKPVEEAERHERLLGERNLDLGKTGHAWRRTSNGFLIGAGRNPHPDAFPRLGAFVTDVSRLRHLQSPLRPTP